MSAGVQNFGRALSETIERMSKLEAKSAQSEEPLSMA
jgi:hypothetical protein